jgi:hypothetical protein
MGLSMLNKMPNLRTKVSFPPFPLPSLLVVPFLNNWKNICRRWCGKLDFELDL